MLIVFFFTQSLQQWVSQKQAMKQYCEKTLKMLCGMQLGGEKSRFLNKTVVTLFQDNA
jgi:hypothetical protein